MGLHDCVSAGLSQCRCGKSDEGRYRYNRVHGTHVSECKRLLGDVLRKEWGFDGLVMSDWCVLMLGPFFSCSSSLLSW